MRATLRLPPPLLGKYRLPLDEETLNLARQAALHQDLTLENMIVDMVVKPARSQEEKDPVLGMFSDEPELLDQVVVAAFNAREKDSLRLTDKKGTH